MSGSIDTDKFIADKIFIESRGGNIGVADKCTVVADSTVAETIRT